MPRGACRDILHLTMRVFRGIYRGSVCRPYSSLPPVRIFCELYEDPRDGKEYQHWQGYLEVYRKASGLWSLNLGAYILELEDGTKGLVYTTNWRAGFGRPRWAQFLGPGPTAFEKGWWDGQLDPGGWWGPAWHPAYRPTHNRFTISRLYSGK